MIDVRSCAMAGGAAPIYRSVAGKLRAMTDRSEAGGDVGKLGARPSQGTERRVSDNSSDN